MLVSQNAAGPGNGAEISVVAIEPRMAAKVFRVIHFERASVEVDGVVKLRVLLSAGGCD